MTKQNGLRVTKGTDDKLMATVITYRVAVNVLS